MRLITLGRLAVRGLALALVLSLDPTAAGAAGHQSKKKPDLLVRATPAIGLAPATIRFQAILEGGDDGYEEYYCPSIEWEWGDDTISSSSPDCEPYDPARSRITRRYSSSHVFEQGGQYEVKFRLKRRGDVLALATVVVQVSGVEG